MNDCDEAALIRVSRQLGRVVKPRNEVGDGAGISNIRFAPGMVGKGYSDEGKLRAHVGLCAGGGD